MQEFWNQVGGEICINYYSGLNLGETFWSGLALSRNPLNSLISSKIFYSDLTSNGKP